jgi:hypothetical protein
LLQNQQSTLANFKLGIDEANTYEFEGVTYSRDVPTKSICVEGLDDRVVEEDISRACNDIGLVPIQIVVNPNREMVMLHFKSVGDAKDLMRKLKSVGPCTTLRLKYASKEAVITQEMLQELVPEEEELGRGARRRAREKLTEERVQEFERVSAVEAIKPPKLPKKPDVKFYHLMPNLPRLLELYDAEVSLIIRRYEKTVEQAKLAQQAVPPPPTEINPKDYELSSAEIAERESILSEGFQDWSFSDFQTVLSIFANFGRHSTDKVVEALKDRHPEENVRTYIKAFWQRGAQIVPEDKWKSLMNRIEAGEKKAKAAEIVREAIAWKLRKLETNPDETIVAGRSPYEASIDKHILVFASESNCTDFVSVSNRLHALPECRFDFYVRTRSDAHIATRFRNISNRIVAEKTKSEDGGERQRPQRTSLSEKKRNSALKSSAAEIDDKPAKKGKAKEAAENKEE